MSFNFKKSNFTGSSRPIDIAMTESDLDLNGTCASRQSAKGQLEEITRLVDFQRDALDAAAIVAVTDRSGNIISANSKFCELSGYSEAELIGANHRIIHSGVHDRAFFANLYKTITRGDIWHDVICNRAKTGKLYWVDTTIVPHPDKSGYTAIRFDVTPQKEAEQRYWRLANIDPLTQLANRRRFLELLSDATQAGRSFTAAILDLDHFKDVNDTWGHDAGDRVLTKVADLLRNQLGNHIDSVARLGGDEFAMILHDEDGSTAREKISAIIAAIQHDHQAEADHLAMQASIGAAVFPTDGTTAHDLMKCADIALYAAKRSGRGCARMFYPKLQEMIDQRARLRGAIRHAIDNQELFLLYQPIVDLAAGRHLAFEALLRWRRDDGSVQTPATFGEVFDDERVASEIGEFVLNGVLEQIDRWNRTGVPFRSIAINATLGDFRSPAFVDRIIDEIDSGHIQGAQLCVEITEGMLLDKGAKAVRDAIQRLSAVGVDIAFDDFGTGFASLTHLRQLPINHVKIDRSFINAICVNHKDRVIVESVIELAHRLGLKVVAEGVEMCTQAQVLRHLNCDSIQGFLVAPALTEQAAISLAQDGNAADRLNAA